MSEEQRHFRVAIVGAGFSGLGAAIRLRQRGIEDLVILEQAAEVGGCWQANTYPGCMCDVPSHLYSFSFAPNPRWRHTYSTQPQILDYLRGCADSFGLRGRIRTGVRVEQASWEQERARWLIQTSAGELSADVLLSAMGPLTEPALPEVQGLDRFAGKVMHSARWDHDYDLAGKRVASIGTGASAIQYVPAIQPLVRQLYVFQRTAPWVMPHGDRPIGVRERRLYERLPLAQRAVRGLVYASKEALVLGMVKRPSLMGPLESLSRRHLRRQVRDPRLRALVSPDYALGCKRIVPSNRWYPALQKPNVELVPGALSGVRERSVIDARGVEREVDAIVLGTGFHVTDPPVAGQLRGREGRLLGDLWRGSPRAYLGTSMPGFPNLFMLLGPNTGLGHSSMVYMIESQIEHVLAAMQALDSGGAHTIEVRERAFAEFNREIDERMPGTVWNSGCASFYVDSNGRNSVLWPDWTWRFRARAGRFDAGAYELRAGRAQAVAA